MAEKKALATWTKSAEVVGPNLLHVF